jgi:hypothetical protein
MKKNLFTYLFLFIFPLYLTAGNCCNLLDFNQLNWCENVSVEARINCFSPESRKVRAIYGQKWADYQLQFNYTYDEQWTLFTAINGFSRKGHSLGYQSHKTRLRLLPLSLGVEYSFKLIPCLDYYVGAGASYSFLRIHDHSHFVHEHIYKNAFGGIFKTGVKYFLDRRVFIDLGVDYFYQHFHFKTHHDSDHYVKRHSLNMSAFKAGLGLGINF